MDRFLPIRRLLEQLSGRLRSWRQTVEKTRPRRTAHRLVSLAIFSACLAAFLATAALAFALKHQAKIRAQQASETSTVFPSEQIGIATLAASSPSTSLPEICRFIASLRGIDLFGVTNVADEQSANYLLAAAETASREPYGMILSSVEGDQHMAVFYRESMFEFLGMEELSSSAMAAATEQYEPLKESPDGGEEAFREDRPEQKGPDNKPESIRPKAPTGLKVELPVHTLVAALKLRKEPKSEIRYAVNDPNESHPNEDSQLVDWANKQSAAVIASGFASNPLESAGFSYQSPEGEQVAHPLWAKNSPGSELIPVSLSDKETSNELSELSIGVLPLASSHKTKPPVRAADENGSVLSRIFARVHAQRELAFANRLSLDAEGDEVRHVQEWLTLHGLSVNVDGIYDPPTVQAVTTFQESKHLPATGVVDPITFRVLTKPMRDVFSGQLSESNQLFESKWIAELAERHFEAGAGSLKGNTGPWVRLYLNGEEGREWTSGFVSFVIEQTIFTAESPLFDSAIQALSVPTLEALQKRAEIGGLLKTSLDMDYQPKRGDVFLVERVTRGGIFPDGAGFVIDVNGDASEVEVIEVDATGKLGVSQRARKDLSFITFEGNLTEALRLMIENAKAKEVGPRATPANR